jgi:hypothetical protein
MATSTVPPKVPKVPTVPPTGQAVVAAFAAIVVLAVITFVLCGMAHKGYVALVTGKDGRISTSRFQAAAWTYAICFALLTLLFGHWFYNASAFDPGWSKFLKSGLNSDYLWLLGIPATGLAGAKLITEGKVADDPAAKPPKPEPGPDLPSGLTQGLKELTGNDAVDPQPSLPDLQYVVFNLIALAYFLSAFFGNVGDGLPGMPDTLIALTGVSAASYLATKAAARNTAPTIGPVVPSVVVPGAAPIPLAVSGTGFLPAGASGAPKAMLGGVELPVTGATDTQLTATVPTAAEARAKGMKSGQPELIVISSAGIPSAGKQIDVTLT